MKLNIFKFFCSALESFSLKYSPLPNQRYARFFKLHSPRNQTPIEKQSYFPSIFHASTQYTKITVKPRSF